MAERGQLQELTQLRERSSRDHRPPKVGLVATNDISRQCSELLSPLWKSSLACLRNSIPPGGDRNQGGLNSPALLPESHTYSIVRYASLFASDAQVPDRGNTPLADTDSKNATHTHPPPPPHLQNCYKPEGRPLIFNQRKPDVSKRSETCRG